MELVEIIGEVAARTIRRARYDERGTYWLTGGEIYEDRIASSIDISLSAGSLGVVYFLAKAYSLTKEDSVLRCIDDSIVRLWSQLTTAVPTHGLYDGIPGFLFGIASIGNLVERDYLGPHRNNLQFALDAILRITAKGPTRIDGGLAGSVCSLLVVSESIGDPHLIAAIDSLIGLLLSSIGSERAWLYSPEPGFTKGATGFNYLLSRLILPMDELITRHLMRSVDDELTRLTATNREGLDLGGLYLLRSRLSRYCHEVRQLPQRENSGSRYDLGTPSTDNGTIFSLRFSPLGTALGLWNSDREVECGLVRNAILDSESSLRTSFDRSRKADDTVGAGVFTGEVGRAYALSHFVNNETSPCALVDPICSVPLSRFSIPIARYLAPLLAVEFPSVINAATVGYAAPLILADNSEGRTRAVRQICDLLRGEQKAVFEYEVHRFSQLDRFFRINAKTGSVLGFRLSGDWQERNFAMVLAEGVTISAVDSPVFAATMKSGHHQITLLLLSVSIGSLFEEVLTPFQYMILEHLKRRVDRFALYDSLLSSIDFSAMRQTRRVVQAKIEEYVNYNLKRGIIVAYPIKG